MKKDISFRRSDYGFSYRAAAIIVENGKALLQCFNGEYAFIGGQVAENELASAALKREFLEEVGVEPVVGELFAVGETFFTWDNIAYQQIGMYFYAHLPKGCNIPKDGSFNVFDEYGNKRVSMEFCWVLLDDLDKITLYPKELICHIRKSSKEILHFISKD